MRCEACGSVMRGKKAWLYRCGTCGFLVSTLRPAEGTGVAGLETLRRHNYEIILDKLERISSLAQSRVLEVGPAWGWFLEAAQRRGAKVHGIEAEVANAELARQHGLDVETGFFPADLCDRGPYDTIIFNDVFEHLANPSQIVRESQKLLNIDGRLILNLPSSDGVFFKLATVLDACGASSWLDRLWQKDFPSPHVSYFNSNNLQKLVEGHSDLRLVESFRLNSVSRDGLAARIGTSHHLASGVIAFAGIWALSFLLPVLPSDARVFVFHR